jgi:cell division protein FtsX
MDFTKSGMWKAVLGGGIIIAIASYIYQIYTKEASEEIKYRPVLRDFCLGACVTAAVYMFLPESIDSFIESTATAVSTATTVASPSDIELQTGPARF